MVFELQIGNCIKLCSEVSARHCKSAWQLSELRAYARKQGILIAGKSKSQLCALIYADKIKEEQIRCTPSICRKAKQTTRGGVRKRGTVPLAHHPAPRHTRNKEGTITSPQMVAHGRLLHPISISSAIPPQSSEMPSVSRCVIADVHDAEVNTKRLRAASPHHKDAKRNKINAASNGTGAEPDCSQTVARL